MKTESSRVCVVGAGNWGENHIRVLNEFGVLSGIVDKDESRLEYFGELYEGVELYSSLNSALSSQFDGSRIIPNAALSSFCIRILLCPTTKTFGSHDAVGCNAKALHGITRTHL